MTDVTFIAALMSNPMLLAGFLAGIALLTFGVASFIGRMLRRKRRV